MNIKCVDLLLSLSYTPHIALCVCFAVLEKAIDIVPRKVLEWAVREKRRKKYWLGLYEAVKVRVGMDPELSEEFEVKVGMH